MLGTLQKLSNNNQLYFNPQKITCVLVCGKMKRTENIIINKQNKQCFLILVPTKSISVLVKRLTKEVE